MHCNKRHDKVDERDPMKTQPSPNYYILIRSERMGEMGEIVLFRKKRPWI